jgi:hypothetical protein
MDDKQQDAAPEVFPADGGSAVATQLTLRTSSRAPAMPAYFYRLSQRAQRTYLKGDSIERFDLVVSPNARNALETLMRALESDNLATTTACAQSLATEVCHLLGATPVRVNVKGVRPRNSRSELHGLYHLSDPRRGKPPYIELWMRTAQRHDVVKPRTFVRTLMHEVGHHLDYALLRLDNSFHNSGFFKRESSLVRALFDSAPA